MMLRAWNCVAVGCVAVVGLLTAKVWGIDYAAISQKCFGGTGVTNFGLAAGRLWTQRDGLDYSAIARKVGPPKAGHARIVVLREKGFGGMSMGRGTFSSMERRSPALRSAPSPSPIVQHGKHELTATEAAFPGVTRHEITAQSGQTISSWRGQVKRKNAMMRRRGRYRRRIDWGWRSAPHLPRATTIRADRLFSAGRGGRENNHCGA